MHRIVVAVTLGLVLLLTACSEDPDEGSSADETLGAPPTVDAECQRLATKFTKHATETINRARKGMGSYADPSLLNFYDSVEASCPQSVLRHASLTLSEMASAGAWANLCATKDKKCDVAKFRRTVGAALTRAQSVEDAAYASNPAGVPDGRSTK